MGYIKRSLILLSWM